MTESDAASPFIYARGDAASLSVTSSPAVDNYGRAVAVLARRVHSTRPVTPAPLTDLEPRLAAHERPAPDLADYDQLLGGAR